MPSKAKRSALELYKAKRRGDVVTQKADSDSDGDLYDEVPEEEYRSIVRGRMMNDDFIEDDDGGGYVDNGVDEWERQRDGDDDDEEDEELVEAFGAKGRGKGGKKGQAAGKRSLAQQSDYIGSSSSKKNKDKPSGNAFGATGSLFATRHDGSAAAPATRKLFGNAKQNTQKQDDDFLSNIFGELENPAAAAASNTNTTSGSRKRPAADSAFEKFRMTRSVDMPSSSSPRNGSMPSSDSVEVESPPEGTRLVGTAESRKVKSLAGKNSAASGRRVHVQGGSSPSPPWNHAEDGDHDDQHSSSPLPKKLKTSDFVRQASITLPGMQQQTGADEEDDESFNALLDGFGDEDGQDEEDRVLQVQKAKAGGAAALANGNHTDIRVNHAQVADGSAAAGGRGAQFLPQKAAGANMMDWRDLHASLLRGPEEGQEEEDEDARARTAKAKSKNGKADSESDDDDLPSISAAVSAIASRRRPVPTSDEAKPAASHHANGKVEDESTTRANYLEKDSSDMHFYWLDYFENKDKVYLIGKVKNKTTGKYESCCVTVEGIERCLYVLPKRPAEEQNLESSKRIRDERLARKEKERKGETVDAEDEEEEDVEEQWQDDLLEEFDGIRTKHKIKDWMCKWVIRNYAFELPDVPKESKYLKVRYGFDEPVLPLGLSGDTFSHVFGTNTSAFEIFVLKRKIMGPCWLRLQDVTIGNATPTSWCKLEVRVDEPKSVSTFADSDTSAPKETPPLNIMSLSLRTIVNVKENKKEILSASARTWAGYSLDDARSPEKVPSTLHTFVRALGSKFPDGFEKLARASRTKLTAIKFERGLLNALLAHIQQSDPDVIIGHELVGVSLDVLLHRMKELKVDHFSKIGRLRRPTWPVLSQKWNVPLLAGRLICDLASDCGKSMITSTTWSLTEMASTHLQIQRDEIDSDETAGVFVGDDPAQVITFLHHTDMDAYIQFGIAAKVQILQLTKQLTNIAGNSWNRTLNGGRAERNEYILIHDFYQKKFICPDKLTLTQKRSVKATKKGDDGEDEPQQDATVAKKDKFKGGLVFEPKKGLCDKYVLVMDFNSLYPSIIQEFNIDFTTIHRAGDAFDDVDAIPDVPSSDVDKGVLPTLIAKLVEKRKEVKGLMKDKRASPSSLAQWNVKQLALKLTANSMYGCLGFEASRFYARPLAALTTFKGREILTKTRELAESMGLEVIYGDTDSVMINTNVTEHTEALKIGQDFKRSVNKQYKLLEIDIDAVFRRMLLLQKKKYAALKVEDDGKTTTKEIKGLDMKRREYSVLSKDASAYVLDQILSGDGTEVVVEHVHDFMRKLSEDVRESRLPLEAFIIYKRLGKDPSDYPDAKSQPHVQVALRMKAKGNNARAGDVIPYVFCRPEGEAASTKSAQADRAFHPDDLRRADSKLTIDVEYYLSLQVLPPIERLCESIEGTDKARLAECLGLDITRYASASNQIADRDATTFGTLDSQIPAEERFKDCERLQFTCGACSHAVPFEGLLQVHQSKLFGGDHLRCPSVMCKAPLNLPSLVLQLQQAVADHIGYYYAGWKVCSDSGCGLKSRLTGVYAKRCLAPGCHGEATQLYGDKALFTQLSYYAYLFDVEALRRSPDGMKSPGLIAQIASQNRLLLTTLAAVVHTYLEKSGRKYVDLGNLFHGVKISQRI